MQCTLSANNCWLFGTSLWGQALTQACPLIVSAARLHGNFSRYGAVHHLADGVRVLVSGL